MDKKTIAIIGLVVLLGGGYFLSTSQQNKKSSMTESSDTMKKKDLIIEPTGEMMKKDEPVSDAMMKKESRYVTYSKTAFDAATNKKRVYFFHATWCPTCKVANAEFTKNENSIPTDVVVFKTDYDTEKELKKQYAITYQHTFVLVDAAGKEIKKWNGGGIAELIENTK